MQLDEAMRALEKAGTAQNRKVYARHGIGPKQFGVSYAALDALAKKIKVDQPLAEALWATGTHDARVLATKIADPAAIAAKQLEAWVKDLDNYVITDAFSGLAARTPHAHAKAEAWRAAKGEWVAQAGWNVAARAALQAGDVDDAYYAGLLREIERGIHSSPNRVRHAMNNALIGIGMRSAAFRAKAVAAAKRIGKVEVDHGETGCKTPDAVSYIERAWARKRSR